MRKSHQGSFIALVLLACSFVQSCSTPKAERPGAAARTPRASPVTGAPTGKLQAPIEEDLLGMRHKGPVSMQDAVLRAVAWNPAITEAAGRIGERYEEINVAKAGYYPKIGGGLSSALASGGSSQTGPAMNVSVSQMVFDFGKVSQSVKAGEAGYDISHAQMQQAVDEVIRDTSQALVEVQRNRELRRVAEQQLSGVRAIAELVTERSDSGAATKSDKVQAAARVQAAEAMILEVSSTLNRWESTLSSLTGVEGAIEISLSRPAVLDGSCAGTEPDWDQLPGVVEAEAGRRSAVAKLALSRAEIYPTLSLKADGSYALSGERSGQSNPDFSIGLNLSGNFYQGGANAARSSAAGYAVKAAEAARETAKFEAGRSLREARGQISGLKQLASSLSSRESMMVETRDLYRDQYLQLGTRTLLDLLNAEEELHTARFDAVNTEHDMRRLAADCLFNSGRMRDAFGLTGRPLRGVTI